MQHVHDSQLADLFASQSSRKRLLDLLACTIPRDIDISLGAMEVIIAHQLKQHCSDDAIYEHLRVVAQQKRKPEAVVSNFSRRTKNRASDLVEIISPMTTTNRIPRPATLLDVGCAEGL